MRALLLTACLFSASSAAAQFQGFDPVSSSTVPVSTATFGVAIDMRRGPWVIGDAYFQGVRTMSPYALRDRIRARRGMLYTPSDITTDITSLAEMPQIVSVKADLYAIPDDPVPDNFKAIAVSTMMVRVVYTISEKEMLLPGLTPGAPAQAADGEDKKIVPVAQSGIVMTPTAYRGINQYNRPGLSLDINTVYFIGRLYGKNSISTKKTNYIDRIGVWFVSADAKMQIQSEGDIRPAVAVGGHGTFHFRDAPQPKPQGNFTVTFSPKKTRTFSDGYLVATKSIFGVKSSLGFAHGNAGDRIGELTEFLNPDSLFFLSGKAREKPKSNSVLFGSLMYLPKPNLPLAIEFLKPNGMVLNPILINLKVGYFLKLNFDLAYLKFDGGWDLLGMFQFRYTHFPRRIPVKKN
ncbi:MAG: hypothetical protein V3S11_06360 [Elusimicrobiota bacterium]